MAVTSIWPIKGRVDKVINYARNPEKTHDKEKLSELHEIEGVVEYAADEMKTEKRAYVTCLNLHSEETAAQEFMETKRLMHNEGGRSCYHGYQSFKADEVDADTAHSIRIIPRTSAYGSDISYKEAQQKAKDTFDVGGAARIPIPTIYLSISRLYPLGERVDTVTVTQIKKTNKLYCQGNAAGASGFGCCVLWTTPWRGARAKVGCDRFQSRNADHQTNSH